MSTPASNGAKEEGTLPKSKGKGKTARPDTVVWQSQDAASTKKVLREAAEGISGSKSKSD
jgi:hypothetical protein